MSSLRKLQRQFRDALLADEAVLPVTWISQSDPARRLGIYRNNVFTNLRETLRTLYPVVERLVGTEFFNYAAEHYIQRYPSPAGDLNRFGAQLADFLASFEPVTNLPYLPDTARLERLAHQVYHAAEHVSLNPVELATIPPECYEKLYFTLHPAAALLTSNYPVHRIWQVNQPGYEGEQYVDLDSGGVHLLIERRNQRIELQPLHTGEWQLLHQLSTGHSFATAAEAASVAETNFDLTGTLSRLITQATLIAFTVDENTGEKPAIKTLNSNQK